jgi:CheY-like chemotaxis protein
MLSVVVEPGGIDERVIPLRAGVVRPHGKPTILLAEDNLMLRNLIRCVLTSAGYSVLPAADGHGAWELFRGHPCDIDMVVTDFEMPHMNGFELASAIVRLRPEMRILVVSGTATDSDLKSAGWDRLDKPFLPQELVDKVTSAFVNG